MKDLIKVLFPLYVKLTFLSLLEACVISIFFKLILDFLLFKYIQINFSYLEIISIIWMIKLLLIDIILIGYVVSFKFDFMSIKEILNNFQNNEIREKKSEINS